MKKPPDCLEISRALGGSEIRKFSKKHRTRGTNPMPSSFSDVTFGMSKQTLHLVGAGELREGVRGGFFEAGQAAAENEFHLVGGAVALLGDDDVRHVALFGRQVHFSPVGAIDEHDHVGVLLDGAGFAQVRELRTAFFAFGGTGELAEDQHGDLQFLGETLETARDAGDFFLAGVEAATRGDELKIVNNEQREAFVALEAASLGADFQYAVG